MDSKEAFKRAVMDDDWAAAGDSASDGQEFKAVISSSNFWADVGLCVKAAQPICDAIHSLEADRPFLSQVC